VETFLWGLLTAMLVAIATAAWQKPEFYREYISPWFTKIFTVATVGTMAWQMSASYTKSTILKLIPADQGDLILKINAAFEFPWAVWGGIIGFAFYEGVALLIASALIAHETKKKLRSS